MNSPSGNSGDDDVSLSDVARWSEELGNDPAMEDATICCSRCKGFDLNITVTNTSVCIFLWPLFPDGHPLGRINFISV